MRHVWITLGRRTIVMSSLALLVVAVAALRPTTFKDHNGQHGDPASGKWTPCTDLGQGDPLKHLVTLHADYDAQKKSLKVPPPTPAELKAFYDAAFATCFIDDAEDDATLGTNAPTGESGPLGGATVRILPAAHVHNVKLTDLKVNNTGYFISEIRTVTGTRHTTVQAGGHEIVLGPDASTLFFYGRDNGGNLYLAEFDLGSFPSTTPAAAAPIYLVTAGTLQPGHVHHGHSAAFARFKDPSPLPPHTTSRYPDGSWIGCAPGCCVATGMEFQQNRTAPRVRRRHKR